jgi:hypothetical protein
VKKINMLIILANNNQFPLAFLLQLYLSAIVCHGHGLFSFFKGEEAMTRAVAAIMCLTLMLGGCAGMSNTEQRVLSGGSIGAGSGLLLGGLPGAVIGGGVGAFGGYMYDKHQTSEAKP